MPMSACCVGRPAVLFSQGQLPECERMCQEVIEAHQLEGFGASNGNDALVPDRSYITVLRLMAHLRVGMSQHYGCECVKHTT
jgi:hypothetical protein